MTVEGLVRSLNVIASAAKQSTLTLLLDGLLRLRSQ
jgi:hypothetical protein